MARRDANEVGGIRQWINENPIIIGGGVLLLAIAALTWALWPASQSVISSQYYTVDDGKTWFEHPFTIAPFDYNGQQAYQAQVFTCDGGATRFVGYIIRYTDKGREGLTSLMADPVRLKNAGPMPSDWMEVRKPGTENWVGQGNVMAMAGGSGQGAAQKVTAELGETAGFNEIIQVKCPDGKTRANPVGTAKPEE